MQGHPTQVSAESPGFTHSSDAELFISWQQNPVTFFLLLLSLLWLELAGKNQATTVFLFRFAALKIVPVIDLLGVQAPDWCVPNKKIRHPSQWK